MYCMYIYTLYNHLYVAKYRLFGIFLIKKHSWCFPFALRHCGCDGQLLVHFRSSATLFSLLAHVWHFGVAGARGVWLIGVLRALMQCRTPMTTVNRSMFSTLKVHAQYQCTHSILCNSSWNNYVSMFVYSKFYLCSCLSYNSILMCIHTIH